ncbi:MAG TPA: NADH-quinone oxidoreductase subunit M, partial [Verrucomicrobiae bacterium]|nr:NADH-quinone oxidoreductase subunit M [Verrucomicrobiae bacterium]
MTLLDYNPSALTVLIFSPLLAAAVAACLKHEKLIRGWTLVFTVALGLYSLPLYGRFDPARSDFQFTQTVSWIPALRIHYAVGVDGISVLLVLLTTLIMPLCVLASWRYITVRVKEFMICLLIMETAMVGVFCAL